MAVEYKCGGNYLSRWSRKILSALLAFIVFFLVLGIIAGILNMLGYPAFNNVFSRIMGVLFFCVFIGFTYIHAFLEKLGILNFLDIYMVGTITILFIISFFWKLLFKGYWKLILRPYMVVMTIVGFSIFYVVSNYLELEYYFLCPLFEAAGILSRFFPSYVVFFRKVVDFLNHCDAGYVFAYYVIMWIFCRINVWLSFSSKMYFLQSSEALEECKKVLKEARRKAWGLPLRMKFYVCSDKDFNAFAFAHNKVAINTGTLNESDPELLRGVVAHELGHIAHLDVTAALIAQTNFFLLFCVIMLPWLLVSSFAPKEGEKVHLSTYFIWLVFFLLMKVINGIMNSVHYVCYLIGGKRSEYAADKFAVKIGEGAGILRFFIAFIDVPSGGFSDPHPSMKNRLSHVISWISKANNKNYQNLDIEKVKSLLC